MYGDKLIDVKDMDLFQNIKAEIAKTGFEVCVAQQHIDKLTQKKLNTHLKIVVALCRSYVRGT